MLGILFIIIGAIFLMKNLGLMIGVQWDLIWPIVLIAIGIVMVYKKKI